MEEASYQMNTLYFCMYLTESEHGWAEFDISDFLTESCPGCKLVYYRQLKDGHVPMYREVKIEGPQSGLDCFKRWFHSTSYKDFVEKNPHKTPTEENI
jgi:hypothetical protein